MTKARNLSDLLDANGIVDNAKITLDANEIPNLDASKIVSGDIASARLSLATETKPVVSSVSPNVISNDAQNIVITGQDFTAIPRVDIINTATGIWYSVNTVTHNSATQLTVNLTLAVDAGTYRIRVENPDGLAGLSGANFLTVSDAPTWSTGAGSLGTKGGNFNGTVATVSASGDTIRYTETTNVLTNASLANCSLNNVTGAITTTDFDGSSTSARTHTFTIRATDAQGQTSDREFTLTSVYWTGTGITYLVVAGGGSGGYLSSAGHVTGGGGAGGYLTNYGGSAISLGASTTFTITVGAGGTGGADSNNGSNSSISGTGLTTITSIGGGHGGASTSPAPSGGSGGGGHSNNGNGGSGTSGQGNNGGNGTHYGTRYYDGAGGGGASSVGANTTQNVGGNGGVGLSNSITGSAVTYAGGGGGAARDALGGASTSGSGGAGGGGAGGNELGSRSGANGTDGLGGGGGGHHSYGGTAGHGGDGVVIVRMATVDFNAATKTGTYATTVIGSETAVKWTASGTLVT